MADQFPNDILLADQFPNDILLADQFPNDILLADQFHTDLSLADPFHTDLMTDQFISCLSLIEEDGMYVWNNAGLEEGGMQIKQCQTCRNKEWKCDFCPSKGDISELGEGEFFHEDTQCQTSKYWKIKNCE